MMLTGTTRMMTITESGPAKRRALFQVMKLLIWVREHADNPGIVCRRHSRGSRGAPHHEAASASTGAAGVSARFIATSC